MYKMRQNVPKKYKSCSIYNIERMTIAKTNRNKNLVITNELATVCPHYKFSYF